MVELTYKSSKDAPLSDRHRKEEMHMSIYRYDKMVPEFIQRTEDNLKAIVDLAHHRRPDQDPPAWDVTQLINSLYGIVVFPFEFFAAKPYKFLAKNSHRKDDDEENPENGFGINRLTPKGIAKMGATAAIWNIINGAEHRSTYEGEDSAEEIASKGNPDKPATKEAKGLVVCSFLYHMRNALAHSGNGTVLFSSKNENEPIQSVLFYDECKKTENGQLQQYCIELEIPTLWELKNHIAKLYIMLGERRRKELDERKEKWTENDPRKRYGRFVDDKRSFMDGEQKRR